MHILWLLICPFAQLHGSQWHCMLPRSPEHCAWTRAGIQSSWGCQRLSLPLTTEIGLGMNTCPELPGRGLPQRIRFGEKGKECK